jgi:hypothetical protein
LVPTGLIWVPQQEELDPCPCRHTPTPLPTPDAFLGDVSAGTNDVQAEVVLRAVAEAEANVVANATSSDTSKPLFIDPVSELPDEKPVSAVGMGSSSSGSIPVSEENALDDISLPKLTLVLPSRDDMQLSSPVESVVSGDDLEMIHAKRSETFMGKEACNEDDAEAAVDLDGDEAVQLDARTDGQVQDTSFAQMEANRNQATVVMPDVL